MCGFIRLMLGGLLFIILLLLMRKATALKNKAKYITVSIIALIFVFLLNFVPFENAFIRFDSPAKAYQYFMGLSSEPSLVIQGQNSDLVVEYDQMEYNYLIIPKTEDGWAVGIGSDTICVANQTTTDALVLLHQYRGTTDYYVTVSYINGGHAYVSDSNQSNFSYLENQAPDKLYVTYFAYVSNITDDYCVCVNGQAISFDL